MKLKLASLIFIIVLFAGFCPTGVMAGEWITDSKTNCKVWNENPKPNMTVAWSGNCENGYASGSGILVWYQDGKETSRYEGEMKNGKNNGKGTETWPNGDKYTGDYADGKWHGKGIMIWADGGKYEGDFVDGKYHGQGTYTCANGKVLSGRFENNQPVGFSIQCH